MGANFTVCESAADKWICNNDVKDCIAKNLTVRTNLFTKCINGSSRFGKDVLVPDPQCQYQYLLTKDYFGKWEARTFDVTLYEN